MGLFFCGFVSGCLKLHEDDETEKGIQLFSYNRTELWDRDKVQVEVEGPQELVVIPSESYFSTYPAKPDPDFA